MLHTGDFKMDQTPLDNRLTDLPGFSRLGDEGVDLLLVGLHQRRGRRVHPVRARRRQGRRGRDRQGAGAHHRRLLRLARTPCPAGARRRRHRRPAGRAGRPLDGPQHEHRASDLGLLHVPDNLLIDLKTGRGAALAAGAAGLDGLAGRAAVRAVTDGQPQPPDRSTISSDDTILLASSLIPGNETSVGQVINGLSRLGATVVHKSTALVHVSGHAPAGELRYLLNAVRPTNLMPVHGEWRHLRAHAAIGRSMGLSGRADHARRGRHRRRPRRRPGDHHRQASRSATSTSTAWRSATSATRTLKDRRILGEDGFLSILVAVDFDAGRRSCTGPRSPPAASATTLPRSFPSPTS